MLNLLIALNSLFVHLRHERGQDLIEYALLGGIIAATLLAVGFLAGLSSGVIDMGTGIGYCVDFNPSTSCWGMGL